MEKFILDRLLTNYVPEKPLIIMGQKKSQTHFGCVIAKYGIDNLIWDIIDSAESKEELDYLEIYWIKFYNSSNNKYGYNIEKGGTFGPPEQSTIDKISKTKKERFKNGETKLYNAGKAMSIAQKVKLSDLKGGKAEKMVGIPGAFVKGNHYNAATEFPSVSVKCVETSKVYKSFAEAGKAYGVNHSNFSMYFQGKRKSVAGLQWIKV